MKKLKVDVEDIAMIMDNQDRFGSQYYLDTETGEVLAIPEELMSAIDEGESGEDLPGWELEVLPQAKEIFEGSDRYQEIPIRPSYEGYNLMVQFAEGVTDLRIQRELSIALDGKGAFRRFKNVLRGYPEVEKEWFKFKAERDKEEVKGWLESIGIEIEE
ncbi:MAG: UPF0158 family protein [Thermodesulfobacteriota bacterium]